MAEPGPAAGPWVILLTGPPGSGKTTTARELGRLLGAVLLDLDTVTNPLVDVVGGLLGTADYDDPELVALVREPRYRTLLQVASECVAAGVPVVLVAPFSIERREPEAWARLADRFAAAGARVRLAWLRPPARGPWRRPGQRQARRPGRLPDRGGGRSARPLPRGGRAAATRGTGPRPHRPPRRRGVRSSLTATASP